MQPRSPRIATGVFVLAAMLQAGAGHASTLRVEASGFADDTGSARMAVFSSRVGFPDQPRHTEAAPPSPAGVAWDVPGLPMGDHAVLVWHDRNDNGRLDRSMFGAAQEPYGFSNGSRDKRPEWDQARFTLGPEPLTVPIVVE